MGEKAFDEKQYIIFRLGLEVFGLEINKVKEIIMYQKATKIPGTMSLIEGIINLRGYIIPIYSLWKRFGFSEVVKTESTRMVVVEAQDSTLGIVVDSVSEVVMIPDSAVEKPSAMIASEVDVNYIAGIAKMKDELVIILDLEKVINVSMAKAV